MTLRIHLLPESSPAAPSSVCAELRLINPYTHPSVAQRVKTSIRLDGGLPGGRLDAVVMQRGGQPECSFNETIELVGELRRRNAKLIYDIDDNLLTKHPTMTIEAALEPARPTVRFLAREADLIVCSTNPLIEMYKNFRAPKVLWPNAIDERMIVRNRNPRPSTESSISTVGYAGTPTHLPDLLSVTESLRAIMRRRANKLKLDFIGVAREAQLDSLFGSLIASKPRQAQAYRVFFEEMQRASPWDVAIAPLQRNTFNETKSDVKFLDYAVFGIPAVYTESQAYHTVKDGETGLIAKNRDFGQRVGELLDSPLLRSSVAEAAYDYVLTERTLEKRASNLVDLIETVL